MEPTQHPWQAVGLARLCAGIILSPIVPATLSAAALWGILYFAGHGGPLDEAAREYFGGYLLAAEVWTLIVTLVGLWVMSRRGRRLGQIGCQLLGVIGAFTFPFCDLPLNLPFDPMSIAYVALVGIFALPFGALGGLLLWLIAFARPDRVRS